MRLFINIILYIIFCPQHLLAQYPQKTNDVIVLGHAMYDTFFRTTEAELLPFLQAQEMYFGDAKKVFSYKIIQYFEQNFTPILTTPGGSAANTAYCLGALGAKVGIFSVISKDKLGQEFIKSLTDVNVKDFTKSIDQTDFGDEKTISRELVFITPNAEDTMLAYDGVSGDFNKVTFDLSEVKNYKVAYIEGYAFSDINKNFILDFIKLAKSFGVKIAFSPSSTQMINLYRPDFIKIIESSDILFTRPVEVSALFNGAEVEHSLRKLSTEIDTIVMTMEEEGAVIIQGTKRIAIPSFIQSEKEIIDTTGSGDGFAAGFLYGYTHEYSTELSGKLGAYIAASVIKQLSARPSFDTIQESITEFNKFTNSKLQVEVPK